MPGGGASPHFGQVEDRVGSLVLWYEEVMIAGCYCCYSTLGRSLWIVVRSPLEDDFACGSRGLN